MKLLFLLIFSIFLNQKIFSSENKFLIGKARVIDGDTIILKNKKIRLHGIDAPELNQICYDYVSTKYNCGIESKKKLIFFIKKNNVKCFYSDKDFYGRLLGTCFVNKKNINSLMVINGYAIAYKKYSKKYVDQENFAKINKKGLWKGKFHKPEEWRRKNK